MNYSMNGNNMDINTPLASKPAVLLSFKGKSEELSLKDEQ